MIISIIANIQKIIYYLISSDPFGAFSLSFHLLEHFIVQTPFRLDMTIAIGYFLLRGWDVWEGLRRINKKSFQDDTKTVQQVVFCEEIARQKCCVYWLNNDAMKFWWKRSGGSSCKTCLHFGVRKPPLR